MDLLRLLADGYRVKEIADRLGVVKETVYNTMSGVYGKLGVRGVTPAVLEAVRRGIITLKKRGRGRHPRPFYMQSMANSEERELVKTQFSLFQAEDGVVAHGLEEVVEGQQDGAFPLVGVTTAEL
jgi:DNA-binding CsgD family transcriptional regulator